MTSPTIEQIEPLRIVRNRHYGRRQSALASAGFAELKSALAHTAGNLVPVQVRPQGERFELVYGSLRHQALAELGLPVLAIVQPAMADRELVTTMLAESRGGTPLSSFELGTVIRTALDAGLLPTKRNAAELLGCMLKDVTGRLATAELVTPVLAAFDSPTAIRAPWVPKLREVYERDRAGFPHRVAHARASMVRPDTRALFLARIDTE